jgi:HAD superfamily hydrolase (TIGR01459 family)
MTSLRFVEKLRDLVGSVEVVLSDIWGVVHNGLEAFPEACEALHTYRQQGGTVILITNAPRPADSVQRQLRKLGVADDTYDAIVSSGDLTRHFVAGHPGKKIFWLGPERDSSIHRGLDAVIGPLEQADYIICTGLFDDETESAEDYRAMMLQALERKLPLICANPDIVVERGDRLIYCAGAIAELYRELGGEVIFYGKPHRPIYERAMELAAEQRGHPAALNRVLAIGDSVRTDLAGAHGFGIDLLFVTRGIHSEEFEGVEQLDPASVKELFGHPPRALMRELRWKGARAPDAAQRATVRCRAGAHVFGGRVGPGSTTHRRRGAAPRPGHENLTPSPCPGRPLRSWSSGSPH